MRRLAAVLLAVFLAAGPARAGEVLDGPFDVKDGDTFDAGGQRYRIADVDTPELKGKCPAERMLAAAAAARLAQLLAGGRVEISEKRFDEVSFRVWGSRRWLVRVTVYPSSPADGPGRDVGGVLVDEHLARPWDEKRRPWCEDKKD